MVKKGVKMRLSFNTKTYKDWDRVTKTESIEIFHSTMMKYKLLRMRAKISYMAFYKNMTVQEFFLTSIDRSYRQLVN